MILLSIVALASLRLCAKAVACSICSSLVYFCWSKASALLALVSARFFALIGIVLEIDDSVLVLQFFFFSFSLS